MYKALLLLILHFNCFFSIEFQKKESDRSYLQFIKPSREKNVHKFSKKLPFVKPALLIPGILGTQLFAKLDKSSTVNIFCYKKSDWFSIWLNLEELLPKVVDCWTDNMKMKYHNATDVRNQEGVIIKAMEWGKTDYIDYLDSDHHVPGSSYFAPVSDLMVNQLGYQRGKNLFGAPYDWRLAVLQHEEFLSNLSRLIEHIYNLNGGQKVVLIAHSMGNMFTYAMLKRQSNQWKDKYVDCHVSISGPYLGATKAIKALISGDTEGHSWVLPGLKMRAAFQTMPSSAMMLPRPDLWPESKQKVVSIQETNGTLTHYTVNEYEKLLKRAKCNNCYQLWLDNGKAMENLEPPNVKVHCIYGSGLKTFEQMIYNIKGWPNLEPQTILYGDGDRTVNVYSASACLRWKGKQKYDIIDVNMVNNDHVGILSNATMLSYIKEVLTQNES